MNLKLCVRSLYDAGIKKHPQEVMKDMGISYDWATPQSISDSWWFWNCENIPKELPEYLSKLTVEPKDAIGWGLSVQKASELQLKSQGN